MSETFDLIVKDLVDIAYSLRLTDMALPIGIILWLLIVFLPIKRLDVRDFLCGMTYIVFHVAVGIALILALPQRFIEQRFEPRLQVVLVLAMFVFVGGRWFLRKEARYVARLHYAEILQKARERARDRRALHG